MMDEADMWRWEQTFKGSEREWIMLQLITEAVEAVDIAYAGDRDMVQQFSPALDRWLDHVKEWVRNDQEATL